MVSVKITAFRALSDGSGAPQKERKTLQGMTNVVRHSTLLLLTLECLLCIPASADQIVRKADGNGNDSCDVLLPNVLSLETNYPSLTFEAGDTVVISASGCAQTGGSGKTWKRFLNPSPTSDHKYFGKISIQGVTNGMVPISSVANTTLPPATGGSLTLGYEDDAYSDNGYWSHDDGTDDQCKDQSGPTRGRAVVHLQIHRVATPPMAAGTVYGQCVRTDTTHELCHIDRPDVTVPTESYPSVNFCPGDAVKIAAQGCVQTGGSGKTWKDYVNPKGPNSGHEYFGQIEILGVTSGMVPLKSVVNSTSLPVSTGGNLTLGYVDDALGDNGYYSHDSGTQNQCPKNQPASLDITITHGRDTRLGCGNIFPVTGTTPATAAYFQSETAAAVVEHPGGRRLVVTFNDSTQLTSPPTIRFTPGGRSVSAGASLMGWAYSDDDGMHWTYAGKVPTAPGWPALWGDPAMTSVPDPSNLVVMMSNLAIPTDEFTPGESVTPGNGSGPIGGACFAESTDGGLSFAVVQCISNTDAPFPAGHFYDGETLAATPSGAIFAAFNDFNTSRINVWSAPNAKTPFVQIAEPFPHMMSLMHPRLRAAADGSVYVAAPFAATLADGTAGPVVYINRYVNGAWGTPQQASEIMQASVPIIDLKSQVLGSELNVRMGPQFSFAVGSASAGGQDAVRLMVTRADPNGLFFIEGSACAADLSGCHPVPEWQVGPTLKGRVMHQAFNPLVQVSPAHRIGRLPDLQTVPGTWLAAYYVVSGTSNTAIQTGHMYLNYQNGAPVGAPVDLPDLLTVCSDVRDGDGDYWGDYNDMVVLDNGLLPPAFVSFVTRDQQLGCIERWARFSLHQHVSAVRWNP